ncbi:MAG: SPOR domain-containing protein [Gemmatimonadaceae bacterium]
MKLSARNRVLLGAASRALGMVCTASLLLPHLVRAQSSVSAGVTAAVARARSLTNDGEEAKSRALLDSLVNSASRDSFDAAEALYWRALLNENSPTTELDWKRIVVDVPFSPRASEALLKLSELDMMHANRALARQHVRQLLNDYPAAPERTRAMLVLARSYFDDRDAPRACGVLSAVRQEAPLSAVEVRLQADELQQQCRNVREVAIGAVPDSTTAAAAMNAVPPLATQTAALPPATSTTTPPRGGRAATVNADSVRRDNIARATAQRNASRLAADSIRRDSITRAAAQRTAVKQATDSIRRDSVVRAIAQRIVDSTRRDSVTKAGLLRAASERMADNARRDSVTRETLRRDSIALDRIRPGATPPSAPTTGAGRSGAATGAGSAAKPTREVLVFIADSARADSLSRDAAALETRIHNAVATRDSIKRDSLARVAAKRAADARAGKWTVQVAAYPSKADADALVKRLAAKDITARVAGTKKPYRVQVGRYATKADATAALATLKKNGQKTGFVAEIGK